LSEWSVNSKQLLNGSLWDLPAKSGRYCNLIGPDKASFNCFLRSASNLRERYDMRALTFQECEIAGGAEGGECGPNGDSACTGSIAGADPASQAALVALVSSTLGATLGFGLPGGALSSFFGGFISADALQAFVGFYGDTNSTLGQTFDAPSP